MQRQVELLGAGRRPEIRDRIVDQLQDLLHVRGAIVVVARGPLGEPPAGFERQAQPPGVVGGLPHFVEETGDFAAQLRKVVFAPGLGVTRRAQRDRVVLGADPIHAIGAQRNQFGGFGAVDGQAADDVRVQPGVLAQAGDDRAIPEKQAEQRRLVGPEPARRPRRKAPRPLPVRSTSCAKCSGITWEDDLSVVSGPRGSRDHQRRPACGNLVEEPCISCGRRVGVKKRSRLHKGFPAGDDLWTRASRVPSLV